LQRPEVRLGASGHGLVDHMGDGGHADHGLAAPYSRCLVVRVTPPSSTVIISAVLGRTRKIMQSRCE
jgi:hypothetical protein